MCVPLGGVGNWLLETNEFREWRSSEGEANGVSFFVTEIREWEGHS